MAKYTPEELKMRKRRRKRKKLIRLAVMGICVVAMAFGMVKLVEGMIVPDSLTTETTAEAKPIVLVQKPNTNITKQIDKWEGYTGEVEQTINLENTIPEIDMVRVPESDPVAISYFDDVIFMGDSLADGFKVYTNSLTLRDSKAVYLTQKSTSPRTFLQPGVRIDAGEGLVDVWAVIEQRQPGKMYITLGTNALMGMTPEDFIATYEQLIDKIRRTTPDTVIYVTTITPTTYRTSLRKPQLSFDRIYRANQLIAQMCRNKGLGLINLYDVLKDETGYLRGDIARGDGYHLKPAGYQEWLDYLITHTLYSPENPYLPAQAPAEEAPVI